jgi:hypothetical protein
VILSCKYCYRQTHLCPRCEGKVLVRTINEIIHGSLKSASIIICLNVDCSNYGEFKVQTINSMDHDFVCDECKQTERSE